MGQSFPVEFLAELFVSASAMKLASIAERKKSRSELLQLVKNLPMKLRVGVRVEVLEAALQEGIVRIAVDSASSPTGYRLEWLLESKTLLAYFCGRMWCGDSSHYSKEAHARVWDRAITIFPEKDLVTLFGEKNLRTLRKNRDLCALPTGWELIERIFSEQN